MTMHNSTDNQFDVDSSIDELGIGLIPPSHQTKKPSELFLFGVPLILVF
ncbi:hypothetical protein [Photobacterium damselae]|nr:hypothetical protein [Photobacterium damselae]